MGIANLPLFSALTDKMRWHQTRQGLLTENVANAETPGYRGQDLKSYSFEDHLGNSSRAALTTAVTNPSHFSTISHGGATNFGTEMETGFEITPEGNGVELENEMMKVSENQMDYQAVTTLYSRSISILKTAMGR